MVKHTYKYGMLDQVRNVVDTFYASRIEEAKEFFVLIHGIDTLRD